MTKHRPSREEIIELAAQGLTNRQIADQLGFAVRTLDRDRARDPLLTEGIIRVRAGLAADQLLPCGTLAAYRRHLRHGETADEACRHANAAHGIATDRRRRQAQGLPPANPGRGRRPKYRGPASRLIAYEATQLPEQVEQAIARGLSTSQIMAAFAIDYATVKEIRDHLLSDAA